MTTPIIFLDIDGVCNSQASCRAVWPGQLVTDPEESKRIAVATLDRALVTRIQRVCDATGAHIVIASGWRRWMSLDEIRTALAGAGLTAPVIDVLGGLKMTADLRARAADGWLDKHPEVTRSVVIDDTAGLWWGSTIPRVVPVDGITDADADRAIAILRGEADCAP